jgi:hypothetical protein
MQAVALAHHCRGRQPRADLFEDLGRVAQFLAESPNLLHKLGQLDLG